MTEINRRTFTKTAGGSLLGLTVSGAANAKEPENENVPFLEAGLSFRFGETNNLEELHIDRPIKYEINPEQQTLNIKTVSESERTALLQGDKIVNFKGIKSDVNSIGGVTIHSLQYRPDSDKYPSYVSTANGYEMPTININWDSASLNNLLASDAIIGRNIKDGYLELQLQKQEVELDKKIVHDKLVDNEDIPREKRSVKIDYEQSNINIDPYLTVGHHPNLDITNESE